MTLPKSEQRVSQKRPYSYAAPSRREAKLNCMSPQAIAILFELVGWSKTRRTT